MIMLITCVLMALLCSFVISVTIFSMIQINKRLEYKQFLEEKKLVYETKITEENFTLLDNMIADRVAYYKVMNLPDAVYITDEDQNKMVATVLKEILQMISPLYLDKLSFIYNKNVLEDIIYQKITITVLSIVLEVNGNYNK